jgi:hypothetical protein
MNHNSLGSCKLKSDFAVLPKKGRICFPTFSSGLAWWLALMNRTQQKWLSEISVLRPTFALGACYGLNIKCPPWAHELKTWLSADKTLGKCLDHEDSNFINGLTHRWLTALLGSGGLRKWSLVGRSRSPGACL